MDYALERRFRPRNLVALERGLINPRSPYSGMEYDRTRASKATVCKHYLRDLCKDGDACLSIHEYDIGCMENCKFETNCTNPFCIYQHAGRSDIRTCAAYTRGYCLNDRCADKHVTERICPRYLAGFCPDGPHCNMAHPRFMVPVTYSGEAASSLEFCLLPCFACGNYHAFALAPREVRDPRNIREAQRIPTREEIRRRRVPILPKSAYITKTCPYTVYCNPSPGKGNAMSPTEENLKALARIMGQIETSCRRDRQADVEAKRRQEAVKDSDEDS